MTEATLLNIYIITYNRASHVQRTLEALLNSEFKRFPIYIFNNCSTDGTEQTASAFQALHHNVKIVTHKKNIGACANYLRAIEHSDAKYTWVLCDDDLYNFSDITDLLTVLNKEEQDFIHIGAHPFEKWKHFSGKSEKIKTIVADGYPFFSFSSFLPCSIFKTERFNNEFLIKGYENIRNQYPHMPFFIHFYNNNESLYISKNQLVTALLGNQFYNSDAWFLWWLSTCQLLTDPSDVRIAFWEHWKSGQHNTIIKHLSGLSLKNKSANDQINAFVNYYFAADEKLRFYSYRGMFFLNRARRRLFEKSR